MVTIAPSGQSVTLEHLEMNFYGITCISLIRLNRCTIFKMMKGKH